VHIKDKELVLFIVTIGSKGTKFKKKPVNMSRVKYYLVAQNVKTYDYAHTTSDTILSIKGYEFYFILICF